MVPIVPLMALNSPLNSVEHFLTAISFAIAVLQVGHFSKTIRFRQVKTRLIVMLSTTEHCKHC